MMKSGSWRRGAVKRLIVLLIPCQIRNPTP
jgi:hypothetical protein